MSIRRYNNINNPQKCIIILSSKSSGSSALQNLLTEIPQVSHITKTRHNKNETLYWTKAASILGLPQIKLYDSEVPMSMEKAREDLVQLLTDNLDFYKPPSDDEELIFGGWRLLCRKYSPVFLEKSPHHLHQWSSLRLIADCAKRLSEIDFLFIGLIRNPMDTLYSRWRRWRNILEKHQREWLTAYKNLLKFKELVENRLVIIKYEDIVKNPKCLKKIFDFIGISINALDIRHFHSESIHRWKKDKFFGFQLSLDIIKLAVNFGYKRSELENKRSLIWPYYKQLSRLLFKSNKFVKSTLRSIIKPIRNLKKQKY